MSTTTQSDAPTPPRTPRRELSLRTLLDRPGALPVPAPLQALGFWAAVLLPFLLLGLLFGPGLDSGGDYLRFAALVLSNVAALAVGQGYHAG